MFSINDQLKVCFFVCRQANRVSETSDGCNHLKSLTVCLYLLAVIS